VLCVSSDIYDDFSRSAKNMSAASRGQRYVEPRKDPRRIASTDTLSEINTGD
jgi:hypothetical protein